LTSYSDNTRVQGRRLLIFATTGELTVLRMLNLLKLFRRQIPVPAIANMRELMTVIKARGVMNDMDINECGNMIMGQTGADRVGLGIKTVLECLEEARVAAARGGDLLEAFTSRITNAMTLVSGEDQ
jgi:vesicle-fusing ATPase